MTRPLVDACLFAGEGDMLELRMRTLAPVVDHFCVVACTMTHQGEVADREQITSAFIATMIRVTGDGLRVHANLAWVEPSRILERRRAILERPADERGPAGSPFFQHIERQHRAGVAAKVAEVVNGDPDTVVMVSDVDEIPDPAVVVHLRAWPVGGPQGPQAHDRLVFAQRFHSGALDLLHPIQPWWGTCVSRLQGMNAQQHRNDRTTIGTPHQNVIVTDRAGWHFSWFGTDEERDRKLRTFSHAELVGKIDVRAQRRQHVHANGEQLISLTVEDSELLDWPHPLIDGSFTPPPYWLSGDALRKVIDP